MILHMGEDDIPQVGGSELVNMCWLGSSIKYARSGLDELTTEASLVVGPQCKVNGHD